MADLEELIKAADELPASDLQKLYRYIGLRLRRSWWIVPSENIAKLEKILQPLHEETAQMSEEEINAVIDQALDEVRRERFRVARSI